MVVKAIAPGLVHKTEAKAVVLDLRDEAALAGALDELAARFAAAGAPLEGFLVQEMARGGHETIFGLSTDPRYGPVLMFGLGGKYVEVFRDVRFAVPPLARSEALDVVRGIRGAKLLEGVRGEAGADLGAARRDPAAARAARRALPRDRRARRQPLPRRRPRGRQGGRRAGAGLRLEPPGSASPRARRPFHTGRFHPHLPC